MAETIGHQYDGEILKKYIDGFSQARIFVIGDIILDEYVLGVVELGSFVEFSDLQKEFLMSITEKIAMAINSSLACVS